MKYKNFAIILLLLITSYSCDRNQEAPPPIPPNVLVYVTVASDVPIYQEYIGETLGFKDIDIAARTEGFVEEIHFEEGSRVSEGQLLYTIEDQQY